MLLATSRLQPDPGALDRLLRSGQLRRAPLAPEAPAGPRDRPLSCGLPALDALLGGGLFRGELCELVAPPSAGGTALLRAALAAAATAGEPCALVDPADALDPRGAALAGLDLRRLLWVRPATLAHALRACELLLEARFALVALDLGNLEERGARSQASGSGEGLATASRKPQAASPSAPRHVELVRFERKADRPGPSPWARLSRKAERHRGALLVLSRAAQAGSFAAATVELLRAQPRWEGAPGTPGRLFCGLGAQVQVARARHAPPSAPLRVRLPWTEPPAEEDQSPPGAARAGSRLRAPEPGA